MIVKIKKIIAVLLVVLFLATVTASAVSAKISARQGPTNGQSGYVPFNGHQGYTGHATGEDLQVS